MSAQDWKPINATLVYVDLSPDKKERIAQQLRTFSTPAYIFYHQFHQMTEVMCNSHALALHFLSIFPPLKRVAQQYQGFFLLQCPYDKLTDWQIRQCLESLNNRVHVINWEKIVGELVHENNQRSLW